jgi:hypothetical protein
MTPSGDHLTQMELSSAIRLSLRAFVCGIFGFLPVLGLVPAVYVLLCWRRIRFGFQTGWNPADHYLRIGVILALLGLLGTIVLGFAVALAIAGSV